MSFVITAIGHGELTSAHVDLVSAVLKNLPVKLQSFTQIGAGRAIDFSVDIDLAAYDENPDASTLQTAFDDIKSRINGAVSGVDLNFQRATPERRNKGLVVFDMDSTLIYQEVIELIAAKAGVEAQVEAITTRAMNGELDFKQSLNERVALLKGIPAETLWEDLKPKLEFTKGARELCAFLKSQGCKLAVCSGGFLPLAEYVQAELGLDYAFANVLETEIVDGVQVLSGKTIGDVVDGTRKRDLLIQLARENSVDLSRTVAVGDGANDLLMMGVAGVGVAWNAKPIVQQKAPTCLNTTSLLDALYVFGFHDGEF